MNWKNEVESIFYLLDCTMYFSMNNQRNNQSLEVRIGKNGIFSSKQKLIRSHQEKDLYYKNHSVSKTVGYELHHIVPLFMTKKSGQFAVLDRWENMIYIDGKNHDIISQTGNKNIILSFNRDNVKLSDYSVVNKLPDINAVYKTDILYNPIHQGIMQQTNADILADL